MKHLFKNVHKTNKLNFAVLCAFLCVPLTPLICDCVITLIFAKGERIERETKTEEDLQDCNFKVTFVLKYEEWKDSGLL